MSAKLPSVAVVLATLLSVHGLRKGSLSPNGALTAFIVGYLSLAGGTYAFGATLIGFYLIGSRATKYGKKQKARLEDGYHEAGYRNGWQVLSNSAAAVTAAFLWNAIFVPSSIHARIAHSLGLNVPEALNLASTIPTYDRSPTGWCPLEVKVSDGYSKLLMFAVLGQFSCCLGDTLASELGILSRSQPRLITTFKPVPPGTNGAMSIGGTLASVVGGALVGLVMGVTLVLENAKCALQPGPRGVLVETIVWGMVGGGFGSMLDSLLGATIQQTRYSESKKVVLQDNSTELDSKKISGVNVLSNNQVNLVSSVVCSALIGWGASVM